MKNTAFTINVSISGTELLLRTVISNTILENPTKIESNLNVFEFNNFRVFFINLV